MPATSRPLALLLPLLLPLLAAGAPVRYDQRQEGDFNVHAHLENFVVVLIPTAGSGGGGLGIVDFLKKAGAHVRSAEQPLQDRPPPNGTPQDEQNLAAEASEVQVAVVEVQPKEQQQSKEEPQPQPQREAEEDLQAAGSEALEAVLVAESPALLLARAGGGRQGAGPAAQPGGGPQDSPSRGRGGKALDTAPRPCPQGQFRDATGVCHYIGSDQRVGEQYFIGLVPPIDK